MVISISWKQHTAEDTAALEACPVFLKYLGKHGKTINNHRTLDSINSCVSEGYVSGVAPHDPSKPTTHLECLEPIWIRCEGTAAIANILQEVGISWRILWWFDLYLPTLHIIMVFMVRCSHGALKFLVPLLSIPLTK